MKDIDFYGLAVDGRPIFGQVTYSPKDHASGKLEALRRYASSNAYLVLFCVTEVAEIDDGVNIFPVSKVFESFTSTVSGRMWLNYAQRSFHTDVHMDLQT
jgi:hypothetical protein